MTSIVKTNTGKIASLAGTAALIAACIPCCISLAAPMLAWLGFTSLGALASGWFFAALGVFALGAAAILYVRFRRRTSSQARPAAGTCDCDTACKS